jgi:CRISPR-associated protein Csb2
MARKLLRVSIRFLDTEPTFNGKRDADEPEWPPSPLRLFQAIVAAAASRWRESIFLDYAKPALEWLERLKLTEIVAPMYHIGTPFRIAVPNNDLDVWAGPLAKGNDPKKQPSELKTMKTVHPCRIRIGDGNMGDALHYLYPLPSEECPHLEVLNAAARSITHLGWGIDMVAGDAQVLSEADVANLKGEVWRPVEDSSGTPLRVPISGTLEGLMTKHEAFLGRLSDGGFKPVPPLSAFKVVHYRRATESVYRPWCAFSILKPDASGNRAFDTPRRAAHLAAWVRHVTGEVCASWPDVASFVHGHPLNDDQSQLKGETADHRFQFLPLPTINSALQRVESIRRVLITAPPGCQDRIDYIRRRLPGQELLWDGNPVGLLNILPTSDWVLRKYIGESRTWSTVTPVIWPGYDDHNSIKAEKLLRKAFIDAGLSPELVNAIGPDDLEWRQVGFQAGLDLAKNYYRPDKLTGSMYHVRVRFAHPVSGPLAVGAGRYRGFGLFAIDE